MMRKAGAIALVSVALVSGLVAWWRSGQSGGGGTVQVVVGPAREHVLSALRITKATGSFDMAFSTSATPNGMAISGHGTQDVNPLAIVAVSDVPGIGMVTARIDSTRVWEYGGADYGLTPGTNSGPGAPISGFANLVEETLGPREGAVSMLGLGSATGYLALTSEEITTADRIGTGVVNDVPVTFYRVAVDISKLPYLPGLTGDQVRTIQDAIRVLIEQGYTGTADTLAVDGHGRILQSTTVTTFTGGGTVTEQTTFSHFGAPGRVQMPSR
jgi:hypothetical protein